MNRKNHLLIVLTCLNCVHTTHAVEKSADTQIITQDNGQESWDKLEEQCKLQNLRIHVGNITGNANRDAAIQREKIMQKVYAHNKDALLPDDPLWSFYDELINIRRDIVKDLRNLQPDDSESFSWTGLDTRFNKKIEEWVDSGKMTGLNVVEALREVKETFPHWYSTGNVPRLGLVLDPANPRPIKDLVTAWDQDRHFLATKYPDIAEQRRDLDRKLWAHELNSSIKNEDRWIGKIGAGIPQLDESNTQMGRDMKETVLNTICDNLMGEDQDLKEKTKTLLQQAPALNQMVFYSPED